MAHVRGLEAGWIDVEVEVVVQAAERPGLETDRSPQRGNDLGRRLHTVDRRQRPEPVGHRWYAGSGGRDGAGELARIVDDDVGRPVTRDPDGPGKDLWCDGPAE